MSKMGGETLGTARAAPGPDNQTAGESPGAGDLEPTELVQMNASW